MTARLLLDEMFGDNIGEQLRAKGHDVLTVVTDPALIALPDSDILARAASDVRAVVTRNIKDFVVLDTHYRASNTPHAGIVLVATKTFPHDRHAIGALVGSLDQLLAAGGVEPGSVVFLQR